MSITVPMKELDHIPDEWKVLPIDSVCQVKASAMSYKQLDLAESVSKGVRVVGVKVSDMNLPGNEIAFHKANLERELTSLEATKRTIPEGSIVFPKRGAAIATNKKRLTSSCCG